MFYKSQVRKIIKCCEWYKMTCCSLILPVGVPTAYVTLAMEALVTNMQQIKSLISTLIPDQLFFQLHIPKGVQFTCKMHLHSS